MMGLRVDVWHPGVHAPARAYPGSMTMRVEVRFPRPLGQAQARVVTLALAALAGTRAVRITQGGFAAVVLGEALQVDAITEALAAEGVPAEAVQSSLAGTTGPTSPTATPPGGDRERLRPLGR